MGSSSRDCWGNIISPKINCRLRIASRIDYNQSSLVYPDFIFKAPRALQVSNIYVFGDPLPRDWLWLRNQLLYTIFEDWTRIERGFITYGLHFQIPELYYFNKVCLRFWRPPAARLTIWLRNQLLYTIFEDWTRIERGFITYPKPRALLLQ